MTLYDHLGRPIRSKQLTEELGAPTFGGVRTVWHESLANGLTPTTLATLLKQLDQNDALAFLTLAEEMEEREPHYASELGKRKRAVSGLASMVEAASDDSRDVEIADAVSELVVNTDEFDAMLPKALDAIGKGYSVTEIMWQRGKRYIPQSYKWRDPRFFLFDMIAGEEIRMRDEKDPAFGIPLEPFKFIVHRPQIKMGLTVRGGLAKLACVSYMLKGYTLKDWFAFMEVFGMPWRIGKYSKSATASQKETLLEAVRELGADAACIIPEDMVIDLVEASRGGSSSDSLYLKACEYIDKQVSKGVLGQVASSEGTPGKLGGDDAQENVREDIRIDDSKQLSATIRRDVIKPFIDLNWGPQKRYPKFRLVIDKPEDLKLLSESLTPFIDRGLPVQASIILDKFGIAEAEAGSLVLKPIGRGTPAAPTGDGDDPEDEPPVEPEDEDENMATQSLVMSKEVFTSEAAAVAWAKANGFSPLEWDETGASYRLVTKHAVNFRMNSFAVVSLGDGVKGVVGELKVATAADEAPLDEIDRLAIAELDNWREVMDPVMQPVLDHAERSNSFEEFLGGLESVMSNMDSTKFAERIAVLTTIARGRGDATDET